MKQSLKYGLFLVLALLTHVICTETMEDIDKVCAPGSRLDGYHLSLIQPTQTDNLTTSFHYLPTQSCDEQYTYTSFIPFDQGILLSLMNLSSHKELVSFSSTPISRILGFKSDTIIPYIYDTKNIVT